MHLLVFNTNKINFFRFIVYENFIFLVINVILSMILLSLCCSIQREKKKLFYDIKLFMLIIKII